MEVIGKIKLINETQTFDSGFTKRQIVVSTDEQYSQDIAIDFIKDKTKILDSYSIGNPVKVSINIRGSEFNGKYYVNLQGWRIERQEAVSNIPSAEQFAPAPDLSNDNSDLPF